MFFDPGLYGSLCQAIPTLTSVLLKKALYREAFFSGLVFKYAA